MKKGWKITLITGASILVVGGAWACLTKAGVIPNWFEIEALYSCVDCHGLDFREGEIPQINGKKCCKGSYYELLRIKGGCEDFGNCNCPFCDKPIIYLYPTEETQIQVKLGDYQILSHTYPKYNSDEGWRIIAQPNGDLKDLNSGRKLYALYREGKNTIEDNFDEGFVVAGKDIIPFLEEKLEILGLNEREAEEFIVYWLPQMESNEWNLIRFETIEEQNNNMPLNITPTPDTVIRIMMDWKAIDEPIAIPEQKLVTPERIGFTVVERGGSQRK